MRERLRNGITMMLAIMIAGNIVWWLLKLILNSIRPLENLLVKLIDLSDIAQNETIQHNMVIAVLLLAFVCVAWYVGKFSLSNLAVYLFKRKLEKKGESALFCVRIKEFLGGYPIGIVTKQTKEGDKIYYNICYPNINGFITLYRIPAQETERVAISVGEVIITSLSLGLL